MKYSLRKLFQQGGEGSGFKGHAGRQGLRGGSAKRGSHGDVSSKKRKETGKAISEAEAFMKELNTPFGSSTSMRRGDSDKGTGKFDIGVKVTATKSIDGLKQGASYQIYDKGVVTTPSGGTYKYYRVDTLAQGRTDTFSIGSPSLDPDTVFKVAK